MPGPKSLMNSEELLIMGVVIELWSGQGPGIVGNRPMLHFTPILLFLRLIFSFLTITHPSHVISLLTLLAFIIASFHLLPRTSMTHSCLLVCTSLQFHCIPPCSICFVITLDFLKSLIYKPLTCYIFP